MQNCFSYTKREHVSVTSSTVTRVTRQVAACSTIFNTPTFKLNSQPAVAPQRSRPPRDPFNLANYRYNALSLT